jgi:hypothetical protein
MRIIGIVTAVWACGPSGGSVAKAMIKISYKGYRLPPEIIQQAIWLYRKLDPTGVYPRIGRCL